MAESRFFVDAELIAGAAIALPDDVTHHAAQVLRLRDGAPIVLFNGRGGEFHGVLEERGRRAQLQRHVAIEREAPVELALVQSWIANDKLDRVVEKAVELGAARIGLISARRSVVRLDASRLARRIERLRDIAVAACCQCGRNRIPAVEAFDDAGAALAAVRPGATGLLLQPDAASSLADVARSGRGPFVVAIGPEGGFEPGEIAAAERAGYRAVRLGARILRTETAGLAALAALQTAAGDFA